MTSARILIAEDHKVLPYIKQVLVGYELLAASTVKEAEQIAMADHVDLFLLGIHFDDSRATELASIIRRSPGHAHTPIILIRGLPSTIAKFIRSSTSALKVSGVITDFFEYPTIEDMTTKLRGAIEGYLPADKIVAGQV